MAKKKITKEYNYPTESEVVKYLMLEKLLASSFAELKEFSKKKPDELLNTFKVRSLNRILNPIKEIMKNEPTSEFLELLDEDTIPSYSDAVLIIAQFNAAMLQFKSTYYGREEQYGDDRWFTKENPGEDYRKKY
ncbi:hypothetical protein [Bacteroides fragilis]|uniref:hypothetical protein n=1 Tax=Bacteroides fragilis TaxID=817 RepID=UPI00101BE1F9|nr:hypothetical protein [Bacteroides fragilis]